MLSIKINILYIVLFTVIVGIRSLQKLSTEEDNSIKSAETIIRNTVNKLFTAFKIQESNSQHWLKQVFVIYDFFVSITLKDGDSLKEIVRLSRVYDIDNTRHLISQINEVLNESDKSSETNGSGTFVAKYIERFIGKLKYLKDRYDTNKKKIKEAKIVSHLNVNRIIYNNSMEIKEGTAAQIVDESISNFTEYWRPSARRIYRGFRTRIKNYPFMASVQFFRKFQCAGSIIKNDLVITSASCLQLSWNNRFFRENPAFLSVQIGSDFYEHGGENIAVQEIYFHPAYDPKTLRHNLALMRLSRRIAFTKKHKRVRKIQIDRKPHQLSGYDHITVVGWGARDSSNIIYNVQQNRLAYANLDFYPLDECREHYTRQFVSKQNFCAGFFSKGGGACNRDVGGPAIIGHKLMGVISFGTPICGSPDSPTVFTKLGYYADWIDKIMEQDVPSVYKRTTRQLPYIFTLEENIRTKEIRFTPVIPTSSLEPIYIDDIRMGQKESPNDFLHTQKIAALSENINFELNENKHKNVAIHKPKEINIKNDQISHKIDTTSAAKNKLRQQQSHKDESLYDSEGISLELLSNITTQATIKITKRLYDEGSNDISIGTESESVNDPPSSSKVDSSYDSTETDPESFKQSPSETTITSPQQKVNDDENLNKVSTITVQSTNMEPKSKFTLLQFYDDSSANSINKIKHKKLGNNKKQNIRNFKAADKQKMKTTTSVTTIASSKCLECYSNKFTVQSKQSINRQFDEYKGIDESIKTDTESANSHFTEANNKLREQQSNISDDLIKRYIKQILSEMNNNKKKSTPKVIVKSKMTSIAPNIVLPSTRIKATKTKLKQQQFNEDRKIDESLEVTTEYVHYTKLNNKTQQQFDVSISDDVIKEYIMQYLIEKKSTTQHKVKSKNQKPLIEYKEKFVEAETKSINDKLTHQELNVGGSRSIININKKQPIQTSQNEEKGIIKKVLKTTPTTTTALVTLNKSTGHTKNIFKQLQFDTDNESLIEKRQQHQFNAGGRQSQLIETDIESITVMPNLRKDVNVRDIKDDIIALIDNLDIEQLLDEVDDGKTETKRIGESNDTKKDTVNLKQWTSLKYLHSSNEDETRVGGPVVSFNNLSLTDLTEGIEYNKISKSILFDLVSLAVEEEMKRKGGAS